MNVIEDMEAGRVPQGWQPCASGDGMVLGRAIPVTYGGGPVRELQSMTAREVSKVRELEHFVLKAEQTRIVTYHLIHAGMYARTIMIPAGTVLTGALIKRATILIVNGDVETNVGRVTGYHVLPASAHRKQAFVAIADTQLTMLFPTQAETVEQAEAEFTDDADLLLSRHGENVVNITGEA